MIYLALLAVAEAAVAAYGVYKTTEANNEAALYNKAVMKNQSQAALEQGHFDADQIRTKNRRLMASQRAATAASGIDVESGSAVDIRADSAVQGELMALSSLYQSTSQASNYAAQAKLFGMQARNARMAGYIGITSTLLGGASNVASYQNNPSFQANRPPTQSATQPRQ